jgi:transposase
MRPKIPELKRALQGYLQPQHRFVLRAILAHVDFLNAASAQTQAEIGEYLAPHQEAVRLLQTIPGIQETAAATIIAEIGVALPLRQASCFVGWSLPRE